MHVLRAVSHRGKLLHECSVPGEGRAWDRFPGHINAVQASKDRFLVLYATRSWRGSDDNNSVICQIRDGAYDGPVLREVRLAAAVDDWDAFGDGKRYAKGHLHPVVFGVPKGVQIGGRVPDHAGLFVFMWHREVREIDPETGYMVNVEAFSVKSTNQFLLDQSITEWTQVRLNDAGDDFEVVQPVQALRQKHYEGLYPFCSVDARRMVQPMMPPLPFNREATEWIGCSGFEPTLAAGGPQAGGTATQRFSYNQGADRYEWTQTGPLSQPGLFEAGLVPWKDAWVLVARLMGSAVEKKKGGPVGWVRLDDPFGPIGEPVRPDQPRSNSPVTAFACADGAVRLLTNDPNLSPYGHARNPLYLWEIDPDRGFAASQPRIVFDSVAQGMPIREESRPVVDQAKVFPHTGGRHQLVGHRLRTRALMDPVKTGTVINETEKDVSGIYYAALEYDEDHPPAWSFG